MFFTKVIILCPQISRPDIVLHCLVEVLELVVRIWNSNNYMSKYEANYDCVLRDAH